MNESTNLITAFSSFRERSSMHFSMHATIAHCSNGCVAQVQTIYKISRSNNLDSFGGHMSSRSCQVVRGAVCLTIRALCSDFGIAVISSWYRPLDAFFPLIDNFPFFEKRTSFSEKRICTLSFSVAEQIETRFTSRFGTYSTFFSIPV